MLVSLEDYERLQKDQANDRLARWEKWSAEADALVAAIKARRSGEPIDVDALLEEDRKEREERLDYWIHGDH